MLATLNQLKGRLDVTDDSQDAALSTLLGACGKKILSVCGYVETDTVGYTEILRRVQQAREYTTALRLVKTTTNPFVANGRTYGGSFYPMTVDLIDPAEGVFLVLGAFNWWPLTYAEEPRQSFKRWREPTWPIVQLVYDVTGIGSAYDGEPTGTVCPDELTEATLALAIHWLGNETAGASDSISMGQLSQKINRDPLPGHVTSIMGDHYRGSTARWVR